MLNFKYTDIPDVEQYAEDIGATGTFVYINPDILVSFYEECVALTRTAEHNLVRLLSSISRGCYFEAKSMGVINTLLTYCGITRDELTFNYKGESRLSLDMTHVVNPLLESLVERLNFGNRDPRIENALLVLTAYKDYQAVKVRRDQCRSKFNKLSKETFEGYNCSLQKIEFSYGMSETGRFYTRDDSIQNWPLEIVPSISANKGYFLVWCDFDQIDMRVGYHLFLREPGSDVDKIYLAASDKYQAMYEIICKAANKAPDIELFKKYRKVYKKAILSAMYNASLTSLTEDIKNRELATQLFDFFQVNKKYQRFRNLIDKSIDFNVDLTVRDYFGFKREIPVPSLKNNRERNDAISKCCNTPVQSTSNSIVINWVEAVLAAFEKNGYTRGKDIQAYLIRHDECVFRVSMQALKDLWIFKDCSEIAIDDWDILSLEPHCGINYKVPDKLLEDEYEQSCLQNADKINVRIVNAQREEPYRAIDEVLDVYAYSFETFIGHAQSLYAKQSGLNIDQVKSEEWSEERAEQIISSYAETDPFYQELLVYRDTCVLYSSKLNKYKIVPDLSYVASGALSIGSNKVNCHSLTVNKSMRFNGVMFRFKSDVPEKTKKIMRSLAAQNFPKEWVSVNE